MGRTMTVSRIEVRVRGSHQNTDIIFVQNLGPRQRRTVRTQGTNSDKNGQNKGYLPGVILIVKLVQV